jgi:hypothetical protein
LRSAWLFALLSYLRAIRLRRFLERSQPILREYDLALDRVAEYVMRSVVQIDVISYSVPEHSEGDDA